MQLGKSLHQNRAVDQWSFPPFLQSMINAPVAAGGAVRLMWSKLTCSSMPAELLVFKDMPARPLASSMPAAPSSSCRAAAAWLVLEGVLRLPAHATAQHMCDVRTADPARVKSAQSSRAAVCYPNFSEGMAGPAGSELHAASSVLVVPVMAPDSTNEGKPRAEGAVLAAVACPQN